MSELKPCPFCSGKRPIVSYHAQDPFTSYVLCPDCDARGPSEYGDEKAVSEWNRSASCWRRISEICPPLDIPVPIAEADDKGQLHVDIAVRRPVYWAYYGDSEAMRDVPNRSCGTTFRSRGR